VSRLFEDIQERSRAIDSVALRIAHAFYDLRAFESFDGALRGRSMLFSQSMIIENSEIGYFHGRKRPPVVS
jgi:hypothetical protein